MSAERVEHVRCAPLPRRRAFSRLLIGSFPLAAVACAASGDDEVASATLPIVGGAEAEEGAWPGTAALYKGSSSRPSCGATLVAPEWVLTAGHCVSTSSPTGGVSKVVIGRHRLSTEAGDAHTVDRVIRHAGYANMNNDLALLHLSAPSTQQPAKLPTRAQLVAIVPGAETTVVGWGRTAEGGSSSDVLRQVSVPVIDNAACKALPRYNRVTDNMICAGLATGALDSCQGDSGGPLFMTIDGAKLEIGLVSWGIGCARPNAPGVYTRLGNYLAWLHEKTDGAVGEPAPVSPEPDPTEPDPTEPGTTKPATPEPAAE